MASFLSVNASMASRDAQFALDVSRGEVVAVVGPNGAGKSTLLGLIAGSLRATGGRVEMLGAALSSESTHVPPHKRTVSYVEQRPLLFPHLNVAENVEFGPRSRGARRGVARERARAELAATGLADLAERKPSALSGGQAQRVSIARALAIDPDLLLLDEPFAALDVSVTPAVRSLLRERLERANQTALIVTHDLLDVVALADTVALVEGGRIVAHGPVDELCAAPPTHFMAEFVGLNLMHGQAVETDVVDLGGGLRLSGIGEVSAGSPARATFPPNAVSLHRHEVGGSPRNALPVVVRDLESQGAVVSVALEVEAGGVGVGVGAGAGLGSGGSGTAGLSAGAQRLRAHVTPAAIAELNLLPGDRVVASIKASQVALYPVHQKS